LDYISYNVGGTLNTIRYIFMLALENTFGI
jgi:hypothetical protein